MCVCVGTRYMVPNFYIEISHIYEVASGYVASGVQPNLENNNKNKEKS